MRPIATLVFAILPLVAAALPVAAEEIDCVTTEWKLLGANHKVCVNAFEDPDVPGVVCYMVINGRPGLACHTKTKDLPDAITLMPLPVFKLVGDLSVDTGTWFRGMYQKVESWVHTDKVFDPKAPEERMDNHLAEQIYELDRCIECGCCVAACGTALMREDFLGAVALNRLARFILDPRDERTEKAYFEIVGTDEGIFGCMGLLACEDVCPKQIPLQEQLGKLRRKMALAAVKNILPRFLKKDF